MTLRYTTVAGFWKFIGINESKLDFQPGNTPSLETVAGYPVSSGDYYLSQLGVNPDTLKLYAGSTELVLDTHYTFDSNTSKVSITSDGESALSGEDLTAEYEHSQLGKDLNYDETVRLLEQAENRLHREVGNVFANQSDTDPEYRKIVDEYHKGQGYRYSSYVSNYYPLIKLQTTVDTDYTSGGTTISLVDASGFPSSGTIYVGGNKVTYTEKSGNDLTVPSDTPSVSEGATVRGEVLEVSNAGSGLEPTFIVLEPNIDYEIDYTTGEIQLQDSYYRNTEASVIDSNSFNVPKAGVENRLRLTYFTAWREPGKDAEIPEEVEEVIYMMAGRQLIQRTVLKSLAGQRDNFTAQSFGFSKLDIEEILQRYRLPPSSRV